MLNYDQYINEAIKLRDEDTTFNVEHKEGTETLSIDQIKRIEVIKNYVMVDSIDIEPNDLRGRNPDRTIIQKRALVGQAETPKLKSGVKLYLMIGNQFMLAYVQVSLFRKQLNKKRVSSDIEWYQSLGFLYNGNVNFDTIEEHDLSHNKEFNLDKNEFAQDDPIDELDKINYIKGSLKFKEHLRSIGFESKDYYYKTREHFFDKINELENGIYTVMSLSDSNSNSNSKDKTFLKKSTADVVLLDTNKRQYKFKDNFIVVDPETSICYLVDIDRIFGGKPGDNNANANKLKTQIDKLVDTDKPFDIKRYETISARIIKYLGKKDVPRFVLVSLKKNRNGAQFGKATRIFNYHFPEDVNENIKTYESFVSDVGSFVSDMWGKVTSYLSNVFSAIRKEFSGLYEKFVDINIEVEYDRNEEIVDDLNKHISLGMIESSIQEAASPEAKEPKKKKTNFDKFKEQARLNSMYEPYPFEDNYYDNSLFVFSREHKVNKANIRRDLKDFASDKVDKLIDRLIRNYEGLMGKRDIKSFHNKMVNIVSTAIMGASNLPIHMVYEYTSDGQNPFSLHKIKPVKEASQFRNITEMIKQKDNKPSYIIEIINHMDGTEHIYRTMNIFILNYSKVEADSRTDYYFKIRFGTNSSSKKTFMAETSPPSTTEIDNIMKRFTKFKS